MSPVRLLGWSLTAIVASGAVIAMTIAGALLVGVLQAVGVVGR